MYFTVLSCGESVALCLNLAALILLSRRICSQYVCVAFRKQPDLDTGNSWSSSVSNLKLLVCVLLQVLRGLFCCHLNPLPLAGTPVFMWILSAPCLQLQTHLLASFWVSLHAVHWKPPDWEEWRGFLSCCCRISITSRRKTPCLCSLNPCCYPLPQQTSQRSLHLFAKVTH